MLVSDGCAEAGEFGSCPNPLAPLNLGLFGTVGSRGAFLRAQTRTLSWSQVVVLVFSFLVFVVGVVHETHQSRLVNKHRRTERERSRPKKKHIITCAQTPRAKNYFCTMKTKYYHQSYRVYKLEVGFAGTTVIGKNPRPGAAEKSPPQLNRTRAAPRGETITEKICRVI